MNTSMPKFIGITDLRIKTKEIFDTIKNQEQPIIVMRDSKPEAVIVSYEDYESIMKEKRRLWNQKLDELARKAKPYVEKYLRKKGYNPKKISGEKFLNILEEDDKSSR